MYVGFRYAWPWFFLNRRALLTFMRHGATTDTLRSTGSQKLGWMAMYVIHATLSLSRLGADGLRSGFGRNMGDSPMVVVWPSRDANGAFDVTLSQRKAPYETMPKPDRKPPFVANLALSHTTVRRSPTLFFVFFPTSFSDLFVLCRSLKSTFR